LVAACRPLAPTDPAPDIDWNDPEVGGGVGVDTRPETPVLVAPPTLDASPRLDAAARATANSRAPIPEQAVAPTLAPPAPEPTAPAAMAEPEALPQPEDPPEGRGETIHVVQPGETLYQIGLLYGLTWQEIAEYNDITNPDAIDVGQEIRIPKDEG